MGLPPPGPELHAGLFRDRTIREVEIALQQLHTFEEDCSSEDGRKCALEVLEKMADYVVDRVVLERTEVGKAVRKLAKVRDREIAARAQQLVREWKENLEFRDVAVKRFGEKGGLQKRLCKELEEGLFNHCCPLGFLVGEEKKSYLRHYKRLCTHLRARGSDSLVEKLAKNQFSALQVAALPDSALQTAEKREAQQKAEEIALKEAVLTPEEPLLAAITEDYTCPRCSSHRCCRNEVQTGWHNDHQDPTIIVTCLNCTSTLTTLAGLQDLYSCLCSASISSTRLSLSVAVGALASCAWLVSLSCGDKDEPRRAQVEGVG
ncbi:hypothetical protein AK812_SmicGene38917 [Symbiodinium microadriaticum]|uniref:TFIIS N-terminal domain-containing protein n=1 Tax=Symbiodinium microadriaticum TaxID=2951 RepID=A0A1Q9CCJ3_SYMMI|nr:hypothetical protein AK812_SmicGene38917 [Symbiodinium microadriaticum]CAE7312846.1 unnamed protein product [Symbiodinium sp. KB8]